MSNHKKLPVFEDESQESKFWENADSADYIDWNSSEKVIFPNLKPTTKTISLRLPGFVIDELKLLANKRDISYQSLIKIFLKDRINQELGKTI